MIGTRLVKKTGGEVSLFLFPIVMSLLNLQITPTDMSAFDEFILRDGDYSFLDGVLNI